MPIVGWLAGKQMAAAIRPYDHWLAFALLMSVGGKMLWEAIKGEKDAEATSDPTRGLTLLTLSIATSLDALAVGLSMAFLRVSVWVPSVVIGIVTASISSLGISLGSRIGSRWEYWTELAGGIVLILTGLEVLFQG